MSGKSSNPNAITVRVQPISASRAGGQRAHDMRIGAQPDYVDVTRIDLNRVLIAPLLSADLRDICEERRSQRETKRAMKSNACVCVSGIIGFGHKAQAKFDALTKEQQDGAYRDVAEAVAEQLNTTLTGLVVHLDEASNHAHFQCPGFTKDGQAISKTAKNTVLAQVQTIAADVIKKYCPEIERGNAKDLRIAAGADYADTVHKSAAEMRSLLPAELEAKKAQLADLDERIAKNERLAARALEKANENEDKAAKALKNYEIYERRAAEAKAEKQAIEMRFSVLNKREAALNRDIEAFRVEQEKIKAENEEAAKQQKMKSSRAVFANNYRNGSKKERQDRLKKAKGRKRESQISNKLSDNEMHIKRREWAVQRREQQAKEKEQENVKAAQRLNLEKTKLSQREEMAAGLESRLSSFSAKLKIQKEDAERREREIQAGEDRNKLQIIHLDKREKRLNISQSTADELLVSLDKKLKAVASREQDFSRREEIIERRMGEVSRASRDAFELEKSVKKRDSALTERERDFDIRIANHQSAKRIIDFAAEFSRVLPKGVNFESVISNVSKQYDYSRLKPESANIARNFFAMMERSAKEIDQMQGRGAPVQGVPRSVLNKGVER